MEATHNHHGIDRHTSFSTISVLNRQGEEVRFEGACRDLSTSGGDLGPADAVVLEASTGSFWWADQIEARGARCFLVDPRKFRVIKDSWNTTDRHDARNLAKALWVHVVTGGFGIPTVDKPSGVVREVRKLFTQLILLNRQIAMRMNNARAIVVDNGAQGCVEGRPSGMYRVTWAINFL
jgi:transposase